MVETILVGLLIIELLKATGRHISGIFLTTEACKDGMGGLLKWCIPHHQECAGGDCMDGVKGIQLWNHGGTM